MNGEVRRVAVVGAGAVTWIAAMALRRAFRHRELEVTVVDTAPAAALPRGRWTLPSQRGMHAMLGIPEADFIGATGATFKLATEHRRWQGEGSRFMHAHGELGSELSGTPFYKYLIHQAIEGRAASADDYSLATVAARLGRFARPMGEGDALTASFTYGFHLDEAAYAAYLRQHATKLGVGTIAGDIVDVELGETGEIAALQLPDGLRVTADLYLDCTGARAALISRIGTGARDDWTRWLPCDRVLAGTAPARASAPAVTLTTATDAGWQWRMPTAVHSFVGYAYSSAHVDDSLALLQLAAAVEGLAGAHVENLRSGRRRMLWERNCVALGAAAMELEPLIGADLHAAQLGLSALIELFPASAMNTIEAAEYNRVMGEHCDALRDFTLAHYHVGAARPGAFWSEVRAMPLPERLAAKFDLYCANGRIQIFDHESFEETDWAWLLLGGHQAPRALELQMHTRVAHIRPEQVAPLREHVHRLAESMPRHMDFVRKFGARGGR